uniref:G_PROTEIN_RECEP_F1_2 domain-containing protein n=1 Tax=Syphacia muris TaxID=451379 RepID=A0A0N5AL02_9BILA
MAYINETAVAAVTPLIGLNVGEIFVATTTVTASRTVTAAATTATVATAATTALYSNSTLNVSYINDTPAGAGAAAATIFAVDSTDSHEFVLTWGTGFWIIIMAILSVITVVGNLAVLLSYYIDTNIRQPSNYFIFSLAVSDLMSN